MQYLFYVNANTIPRVLNQPIMVQETVPVEVDIDLEEICIDIDGDSLEYFLTTSSLSPFSIENNKLLGTFNDNTNNGEY